MRFQFLDWNKPILFPINPCRVIFPKEFGIREKVVEHMRQGYVKRGSVISTDFMTVDIEELQVNCNLIAGFFKLETDLFRCLKDINLKARPKITTLPIFWCQHKIWMVGTFGKIPIKQSLLMRNRQRCTFAKYQNYMVRFDIQCHKMNWSKQISMVAVLCGKEYIFG